MPEYEFHGTRCAHPGVSHYCAQVAQVLQTTSTVRTTRYFTNLPSTAVFFSFLNHCSGASSHSHFLTSHISHFHIHIHMPHATAKHDTRYHIVVPSVCLNKCNRNRYMYIHYSCVYTPSLRTTFNCLAPSTLMHHHASISTRKKLIDDGQHFVKITTKFQPKVQSCTHFVVIQTRQYTLRSKCRIFVNQYRGVF